MGKQPLNKLVVEQQLAPDLESADQLILAGQIHNGQQILDKPKMRLTITTKLFVKKAIKSSQFVSRGGDKLAHALKTWQINPTNKICLDIGASTGGFTDYLIQAGAKTVYSIDVGTNQFDYSLKQNPNIHVIENFNFRYAVKTDLPCQFDLITCDVSFISLEKLVPKMVLFTKPNCDVFLLFKPQFELTRFDLAGGVVIAEA